MSCSSAFKISNDMKHKRLFHLRPWLATTLLAVLLLLPQGAAAYDFMVDGLCYNYNSDGTSVTVTSYYSILSDALVIPETVIYDGSSYSVTSIGERAFWYCSGLTSVTIPTSVTSIGYHAFYYCSDLASITVESGNTVYDSRDNCQAIIETASNTLVAGCKNTTIPNSVTSIGDGAFSYHSGLTSVTIPNSVTTIGNQAFSNCTQLTSVTIPNSVTTIGNSAFAFCRGLALVSIPNSVTYIGNYAFRYCSATTQMTCLSERPPVANANTFEGMDYENCILYVPAGSKSFYLTATGWNNFRNILELDAVVPLKGDVNGDGKVDIADVNAAINMMLGKASPTPTADVNGDGKVDIADVNAVINAMLGKE